jgi:hypothetical protein
LDRQDIYDLQHVLRNTCDEAVLVHERRGFIFGRRSLAFGARGRRDDDIAETAAQRGYILSLDLCVKLWFLISVLFIMLFFAGAIHNNALMLNRSYTYIEILLINKCNKIVALEYDIMHYKDNIMLVPCS